MNKQVSIGKTKAIELGKLEWWKDKSPLEIVKVQLFTEELCCDFGIYHDAMEKVLGRAIFSHEFIDPEKLIKEFEELTQPNKI